LIWGIVFFTSVMWTNYIHDYIQVLESLLETTILCVTPACFYVTYALRQTDDKGSNPVTQGNEILIQRPEGKSEELTKLTTLIRSVTVWLPRPVRERLLIFYTMNRVTRRRYCQGWFFIFLGFALFYLDTRETLKDALLQWG
jgi:hypothetical protein